MASIATGIDEGVFTVARLTELTPHANCSTTFSNVLGKHEIMVVVGFIPMEERPRQREIVEMEREE
jgi:hypothetical protein